MRNLVIETLRTLKKYCIMYHRSTFIHRIIRHKMSLYYQVFGVESAKTISMKVLREVDVIGNKEKKLH